MGVRSPADGDNEPLRGPRRGAAGGGRCSEVQQVSQESVSLRRQAESQ